MKVSVNGEAVTVPAACTVEELLERWRARRGACAVEVNAQLVPRGEHARRVLSEGDAVEIVTLVGGG